MEPTPSGQRNLQATGYPLGQHQADRRAPEGVTESLVKGRVSALPSERSIPLGVHANTRSTMARRRLRLCGMSQRLPSRCRRSSTRRHRLPATAPAATSGCRMECPAGHRRRVSGGHLRRRPRSHRSSIQGPLEHRPSTGLQVLQDAALLKLPRDPDLDRLRVASPARGAGEQLLLGAGGACSLLSHSGWPGRSARSC